MRMRPRTSTYGTYGGGSGFYDGNYYYNSSDSSPPSFFSTTVLFQSASIPASPSDSPEGSPRERSQKALNRGRFLIQILPSYIHLNETIFFLQKQCWRHWMLRP
jgi:hypothetical protein